MIKILATTLFTLLLGINLLAPTAASAYSYGYKAPSVTHVSGYYKPTVYKYVAPHYRSSANTTKLDNWSTKGNYNPFTGKAGTKKFWQ